LQIKLEVRHFDIHEVIEAESQVVLNALIKQVFQDAYKKTADSLETAHTHKKPIFEGDGGAAGSKLFFDQMAASVPEIIDGSLYRNDSHSILKKEQTLNIKFQTLTTALLIDRPTIW
jgi:hypothetical protein